MRKNKTLGAADDVHETEAARGVKDAAAALTRVDSEARKRDNDCGKVWDHLIAAQANLSHAFAHLASINGPAPKRLWDPFHGLQSRFMTTRNTIGHQCTRKKGGVA